MATTKELYDQPLQGYWENISTKQIYLLYEGNADDDTKKEERTHWNAGAINLRTGKIRKLKLMDFANLQKLDRETTSQLEKHISARHFVESIRSSK